MIMRNGAWSSDGRIMGNPILHEKMNFAESCKMNQGMQKLHNKRSLLKFLSHEHAKFCMQMPNSPDNLQLVGILNQLRMTT